MLRTAGINAAVDARGHRIPVNGGRSANPEAECRRFGHSLAAYYSGFGLNVVAAGVTPFRFGLAALPLVGLGSAVVSAQEPTKQHVSVHPTQSDVSQGASAQPMEAQLPPNVRITAPDGTPLPPDKLRQVWAVLEKDPALKAALSTSAPRAVRRTVGNTDIVVTARTPRGSVLSTVPPTRTFTPLDLRAYGARDVGELIKDLGAEVQSGQIGGDKQPMLLLNGRRISGFDEIADYPTEAIERLEVFTEEVALDYGFPADRKVVNVVTFNPFSSRNAYATFEGPTDGGGAKGGVNGRYLHIAGRSRYALRLGYDRSDNLLESQRNITEPPSAFGHGRYRTLLPASRQITANGSFSNYVFGSIPVSIKASVISTRTDSLLGPGPNHPTHQVVDGLATSLGATASGRLRRWQWFSTAGFESSRSDSVTDRETNGREKDRTSAVTNTLSADTSFTGGLLRVPTGDVSATVRAGLSRAAFDSRTVGSDPKGNAHLLRDRGEVFANVSVPLSKRFSRTPAWIGDLSVNAQVGLKRVTGFGALLDHGYGVYWSPVVAVRLSASTASQREPPLLEQIGAPSILTPNVRVYDFARQETIDVGQVAGGNPHLRSQDRQVASVGLVLKPWSSKNIALTWYYTNFKVSYPVSVFAVISEAVQDAFPDRFVRDQLGRLSMIDRSPVNLRRSDRSQLRWGIDLTKSLGRLPGGADLIVSPVTDGTIPPGTLPPNSRVIESPPGTPLPPEIQNALSRVFFGLHHTWHLEDQVILRDEGPAINQLDGLALDSLGGHPRHEVELLAGIFKHGVGARTNIRWQSATTVRGLPTGLGSESNDLKIVNRPTIDVSLFVNPEDRFGGPGREWMRGLQIVVGLTNVLNARPSVRDRAGLTPLGYQAAYLDPIGRAVSLSIRKPL